MAKINGLSLSGAELNVVVSSNAVKAGSTGMLGDTAFVIDGVAGPLVVALAVWREVKNASSDVLDVSLCAIILYLTVLSDVLPIHRSRNDGHRD